MGAAFTGRSSGCLLPWGGAFSAIPGSADGQYDAAAAAGPGGQERHAVQRRWWRISFACGGRFRVPGWQRDPVGVVAAMRREVLPGCWGKDAGECFLLPQFEAEFPRG